MKRFLPILQWLPSYKKQYLSNDIAAGLTVGVMLIPQGMAYAMIAGLPPVYGLYAAMIPQVIYAIFGTSRQLAVGPVAMDSILVAAGVSAFAVQGSANYIELAILLAMLTGFIQLFLGILRFGFIVHFLSRPVISGFTSAAALIIAGNQLNHVLGIEISDPSNLFTIIIESTQKAFSIKWQTLTLAFGTIAIIIYIKKIHNAIPGALLAVIFGILLLRFEVFLPQQVAIVGDIPSGLPSLAIPNLSWERITDLLPIAATLAIIAYMESISVAKAIHAHHKKEYKLHNDQELIGLGLGNIIGSLFGSYPTTGGFSRSAVNEQAGAKTNLSAIVSAVLVGLTLVFLTPIFYYLPKSILGAIIIIAVVGLFDYKYPTFLWKTNRQEFAMLLITFLITLSFGIKEGIIVGVVASLILLVHRTAYPHIAVLGRLSGTTEYRNIERFPDIEIHDKILIIRHDAQIYFANVEHFIERIKKEVDNKGDQLELLIIHCVSVSHIDSTARQAIIDLIYELNEQKIGVYFSSLIGPVRDFLHRTGFTKEVGEDHFFIDVEAAVDYYTNDAKARSKQQIKRAIQTNIFKEKQI